MTTLDNGFEAAVRASLLDQAEQRLREEWLPTAVDQSHDVLRRYGAENDYRVEPVIDSLQSPTIRRESGRVVARWGWTHEAAPFFDVGVSPHTIDGDPILSFVWEDAPPEIRQSFEGDPPRVYFDSVEHPGLPASGFVRAAIRWLRRTL